MKRFNLFKMQSFNSCGQEFLEYKACSGENHSWELCRGAPYARTMLRGGKNRRQPIARDFYILILFMEYTGNFVS